MRGSYGGEMTQKVVNVFAAAVALSSERKLRVRLRKMPGQRGGQRYRCLISGLAHRGGRWVIEYDSQLALIFASELADFQHTGLGCRFPVHVPRGIPCHVFADEVKIVPAAAHKHLELAGDHGQRLEEFLGLFHRGIDEDVARESDRPRFDQKGKWKSRAQSQFFL